MRTYNSNKYHAHGIVHASVSTAVILFSAFLVFSFSAGFASAEPIIANLQQDPHVPGRLIDPDPDGYTIQEIIDAGGIIIGDKLFDAFRVTTTKSLGAIAPGAGEIAITPIQILKPGAPLGGDFGMKFNALWSAPGGGLADSTIEFQATILPKYVDLGYAFKDNALWITAFGIGNTEPPGIVSVSENVWARHPSDQIPPHKPIANKFVYYRTDADNQLFHEAEFDESITQIWITKDVGANGGEGELGVAHLSEFYQTFSQIPEPGTLTLLGFGAFGLAAYAWRKRR